MVSAMHAQNKIIVGAARFAAYLPLLKNKKVALVANATSLIGSTHLVDTLVNLKINIKKVFAPEHGFRGNADAGELLKNNKDKITNLPIISLYGKNYKPSKKDLKNIDVIIFDIQDVGVRFYTYISTMHYVMEACAENNKLFIVLDRPNPNGFYIDGPVLEKEYRSFVGMHPIPVVHGCTVGELAQMINGEAWLKNKIKSNLVVIPCENYSHKDTYELKVKPSPNLASADAIYLYPSLCLFEGTVISVGRGTKNAFEIMGHPRLKNYAYQFTPKSIIGASKNPPYENILCFGLNLKEEVLLLKNDNKFQLKWLLNAYNAYDVKDSFFNNFFNKLAGNASLQAQIKEKFTEQQIRNSWAPAIASYLEIRKKYLLYLN